MFIDKTPAAPAAPCSLRRRIRRRQPGLERLEGRTLLTLNFMAGFAIQDQVVSINQVVNDAQGNAYVAGSYSGTVIFGMDSGGNPVQKTSTGAGNEGFVVKYSPSGTLDWFTPFAPQDGGSFDFADSLAYDAANQTVYVFGDFSGTVDFDPFGSGDSQTSFDPGASSDGYLVGLSASTGHQSTGLFADVFVTADANDFFTPSTVAVNSSGNAIYIGGQYTGPGVFGISSANGSQFKPLASPPTSFDSEGFIAKFASNFTLDWGNNTTDEFGNTFDNGAVNSLAPSSQGVVFVAGGNDQDSTDAFLESVSDLTGDFINTVNLTTTAGDFVNCSGVVADASGNAYVVGTFSGTLAPAALATPIASAGSNNAFIAKFAPSLDYVWANRFGSSNSDFGAAVGIDGAGNVYMTGADGGPASYGQTSTTAVLRGNDTTTASEAYVIEVSPGGSYESGAQAGISGSNATNSAGSIAVNSAGTIAIAGSVTPTMTLGPATISNQNASAFIGILSSSTSGTGTNPGSGGGTGTNPGSGGGTGTNPGSGGGTGSNTGGSVTALPPLFLGEQRIYSGHGKHKKVTGFELRFSGALNAALAQSTGRYQVVQTLGKRTKNLPVLAATYDPVGYDITISVAGFKLKKPAQAVITGLAGANGAAVAPVATGL